MKSLCVCLRNRKHIFSVCVGTESEPQNCGYVSFVCVFMPFTFNIWDIFSCLHVASLCY